MNGSVTAPEASATSKLASPVRRCSGDWLTMTPCTLRNRNVSTL